MDAEGRIAALSAEDVRDLAVLALAVAEDYHYADLNGDEDRSWCPYNRRGLPGADPNGTCGYGCQTEPECHTGGPYPLAALDRAAVALGLLGEEVAR